MFCEQSVAQPSNPIYSLSRLLEHKDLCKQWLHNIFYYHTEMDLYVSSFHLGDILVNVAINFNYNGINIFTFQNPLH